jgi:RNA recognition motif-containing protein
MKTYVQKSGMWSCAYFRSTFQDLRRHFQAFGAVNRGSNPCRGAKIFIINSLQVSFGGQYEGWYCHEDQRTSLLAFHAVIFAEKRAESRFNTEP